MGTQLPPEWRSTTALISVYGSLRDHRLPGAGAAWRIQRPSAVTARSVSGTARARVLLHRMVSTPDVQVDVGELEVGDLAASRPRVDQQGEHRQVPAVALGVGQHGVDLVVVGGALGVLGHARS